MAESCPFCAIVRGEKGQEIVYADERVVGFLCEPPATTGHVIVVPRAHVEDLWEIGESDAAHVMAVAHRVAGGLRNALEPDGVNIRHNTGTVAGQDVFHFHVHVIPRYEDDTVQPGCVWGSAPWRPPPGGVAARARTAELIRGSLRSTT